MPKYMTYESWLLAKKEIMKEITENAFNVDMVFPVGSVITNSSPTFDPNVLYEGTTWERIKGKVIVGIDEDDNDFNTVNKTGGEKTHTLTVNEMPSHNHTQNAHNHTIGSHTHSVPAHSHGLNAHTHSFSATSSNTGSHTHSVSGRAASAGQHKHSLFFSAPSTPGNGNYIPFNAGTQYVGADADAVENAGAHTHSVSGTAASKGAHTHTVSGTTGKSSGSTANSSALTSGSTSPSCSSVTPTINSTGGGESHNNLQPYITKYVWERTA